jgi:hypothetical protein
MKDCRTYESLRLRLLADPIVVSSHRAVEKDCVERGSPLDGNCNKSEVFHQGRFTCCNSGSVFTDRNSRNLTAFLCRFLCADICLLYNRDAPLDVRCIQYMYIVPQLHSGCCMAAFLARLFSACFCLSQHEVQRFLDDVQNRVCRGSYPRGRCLMTSGLSIVDAVLFVATADHKRPDCVVSV